MPELNRQLAAETWNELYRFALKEYRKQYAARLDDAFQNGYFMGQTPFRNHEEEAATLAPMIPDLIAITQMPFDKDIEPKKQRAQQMLMRYEEITGAKQEA